MKFAGFRAAESRVVEAFTEHLNLHDAVELDLGQPLDDDVSIVFIISEWISAARYPQSL